MSVEKRQKEQEKTSMVVEGFLFANEAEAAQARKEAEGVKYVKEKAQMDDPEMVLRIYNKMIQQRLFDTAVGYSYLKDPAGVSAVDSVYPEGRYFPDSGAASAVEESLRKAKRAPAPKPKTQTVVKNADYRRRYRIVRWIAFILAVCVVAMFAITATTNNTTVLNYENQLINKYEAWEEPARPEAGSDRDEGKRAWNHAGIERKIHRFFISSCYNDDKKRKGYGSMDKIRILVVDDESRMRKLVRDFLVREGYEVLEAGDGEEALDLFYREKDIALIILDVMMPKRNGFEVCREIRETSKVPIIMLTAKGEESDELNGFELGVDEYISKPFSPKILVARVGAILRRSGKTQDEEAAVSMEESFWTRRPHG